ncbi:MAG: hypothetical protein FIB01_13940 [Gemmatimonadetes bacterium]|nr:hypothetical protein [Gemmatimonadota bacterium]
MPTVRNTSRALPPGSSESGRTAGLDPCPTSCVSACARSPASSRPGPSRLSTGTPLRRACGVASALLALAACAPVLPPAPAPSAPSSAAAGALGETQIARLAELLRMEDRRALDLDRWNALMQDPEAVVRGRAGLAAGRIGDSRTTPFLLAALADSVVGVRTAAVFALGRLADTAAAVTAALERALQGQDSAALAAPAALARVNTRRAFDVVFRRLGTLHTAHDSADLLLAREALLALWRFRERPGAAEVAASCAAAQPLLRWPALYTLTRAGTAATIGTLLAGLSDQDPLVRATAARGLRAAAVDSAGARSPARAGLRPLLRDADPHVRINAARALAAFRDPGDATALLPQLEDADGNVRVAAAEALGAVGGENVASALRALAQEPQAALALRAAALGSLIRIDSAAGRSICSEWAAAPAWLRRFYAARVLNGLSWSAAGPLLQRLSRDPDARVQAEAFGALAAADSTLPLGPLFLEGLAAPDPLVRANAASGVARRRDPAFFSALLQAYDRAQRDTSNDAALAAIAALAELAGSDVPVTRAFFLRFPPAADPVIRARVAQRLGTGAGSWGEARPIQTGRDDEFYRNVVRTCLVPVLAGGAPPRVRIGTPHGDVVLALDPVAAPLTVYNFLALIRTGFYRQPEPRWHRVVPNFVLQDGDPRGDGSGGPPWVIRDEINLLRYDRGMLGMALSGPDTGGSQFFITHSPQPHLDGGYTIFGRVESGMAVADAVLQDDPILSIEVWQ